MRQIPALYWPKNQKSDYQAARLAISSESGIMPEIISDLDIPSFFANNPKSPLYYPVFFGATGWWGELLGTAAEITGKITISAECQLMKIEAKDQKPDTKIQNELFAAEINPASGFFKKMNSGIATALDMLATDTGTIMALFAGKNRGKFMTMIESTGNSYLGCIGGY